MKASVLIERIQKIIDERGDLEVVVPYNEHGKFMYDFDVSVDYDEEIIFNYKRL